MIDHQGQSETKFITLIDMVISYLTWTSVSRKYYYSYECMKMNEIIYDSILKVAIMLNYFTLTSTNSFHCARTNLALFMQVGRNIGSY